MIKKIKWMMIRIIYYFSIALMALTGGLYIYVAAPYSSYIFFNDLRFWRYLKHYHKLIIQLYRIIFLWISDPNYRKMYAQPLTAPPLSGPDPDNLKLSPHWNHAIDDCADCINCCIKIKCPLIDHERHLCLSYNTIYWRYFSCGRYPVSQKQIEYYDCSKWEMKETSGNEYKKLTMTVSE